VVESPIVSNTIIVHVRVACVFASTETALKRLPALGLIFFGQAHDRRCLRVRRAPGLGAAAGRLSLGVGLGIALQGRGPVLAGLRADHADERRTGEAARLIEMSRYDHSWGRDFAARVEKQGEKILTEVLRRIGDHGLDVVKEGVEDALVGRGPK
jgi:hypothetical protein